MTSPDNSPVASPPPNFKFPLSESPWLPAQLELPFARSGILKLRGRGAAPHRCIGIAAGASSAALGPESFPTYHYSCRNTSHTASRAARRVGM